VYVCVRACACPLTHTYQRIPRRFGIEKYVRQTRGEDLPRTGVVVVDNTDPLGFALILAQLWIDAATNENLEQMVAESFLLVDMIRRYSKFLVFASFYFTVALCITKVLLVCTSVRILRLAFIYVYTSHIVASLLSRHAQSGLSV
jgi:hypothetical protein